MYFFIFILFRIHIPLSKKWRPWSDAAFCGVWSGSALFAYVPQMGLMHEVKFTFVKLNFMKILRYEWCKNKMHNKISRFIVFCQGSHRATQCQIVNFIWTAPIDAINSARAGSLWRKSSHLRSTIIFPSFQTGRSGQTVYTQIRLLL